ncbi:MAG: hypothetical protein ACE5JK_05685 [Candidatus Omnitrophota bacterium]
MIGYRLIKNQKGVALVVVMAFVVLLVSSIIFLGNMLQQDVQLITKVKSKAQARYMAEAGINHAMAKLKLDGFSSRANFNGTMDTGSYKVTFTESGGRHVVTSEGTVGGITESATIEAEDLTPSALYYVAGAGNNVWINSFIAAAAITGDVHANSNVNLSSGFLISWLTITGDVSASNEVWLGNRHNESDWFDSHVVINGVAGESAVVTEGADVIFFPNFNFKAYEEAAIDSGDYYSTSQIFTGVTLSPANGIVYVKGGATFEGTCTLNGGIVANRIIVNGTLNQVKSGYRNVIIARKKDIKVSGRLATEEAIVYATRDILATQSGADIDVNGIMMAGRDIYLWNFLTLIDYNYIETNPIDMGEEEEGQSFGVISWNQ